MSSAHFRPTTQTRLAGEMNGYIQSMRGLDANLPQFKAILDQIAAGGDYAALAAELGFPNTQEGIEDATSAYNLIGSLVVELGTQSPFWKQVISRMG
jgi:hypothetical protein